MLPIPILLYAIGVGSSLFGAKKGIDGLIARERAEEREDVGRTHLAEAQQSLEAARLKTEKQLKSLARARAKAARVITAIAIPQLSRVSDIVDEGREFGAHIRMDQSLPHPETSAIGGLALDVCNGAWMGYQAGGYLGQVAVSAAARFGVASTGAAINGLSGAAAQKASLAWLGGGALKAGGYGIAGGSLALSGVSFGIPALLMGLKFARKAEERLVAAERYHADACVLAAQAQGAIVKLRAIGRRGNEVRTITNAVAKRTAAVAEDVKQQLDGAGVHGAVEYGSLPESTRDAVRILLSLTVALDAVIAIELHDEAGEVLREEGDAVEAARAACSWRMAA